MKRFFTADFHLGSEKVLIAYNRPFVDIDDMTRKIISNCNDVATEDDFIYHIGDLYCFRKDGQYAGMEIPWGKIKNRFLATVLPLSGNHDENNGVKTIGSSIRLLLGGRFHCVLCHYPSYDERSRPFLSEGDVNICGHAHTFWSSPGGRYYIDKERKILNINVGVDVWGYKPVSEVTLTNYITHIMATVRKI